MPKGFNKGTTERIKCAFTGAVGEKIISMDKGILNNYVTGASTKNDISKGRIHCRKSVLVRLGNSTGRCYLLFFSTCESAKEPRV